MEIEQHLALACVLYLYKSHWSYILNQELMDLRGGKLLVLWQPLDQCPIAALTSKSQGQISSGEYKLCNSQENSIGNYNSILPTIYITIYGPCYDYTSAVRSTLISIPYPHVYY